MTKFVFHHDPKKLPPYSDICHPVQMYAKYKWSPLSSSCIARPIVEKVRDLGCPVSNDAFDFLTIAMAVTAADTFCQRDNAKNSWARELELDIALYSPETWNSVSSDLEKALGYLTGDTWNLNFTRGGLRSPLPKNSIKARQKRKTLRGLDCVCLFSGGLDSAVGAIDLVNGEGKKPLLVSHAYKGDASKQNQVEKVLHTGGYSRLSCNADPHLIVCLDGETDISMRGRSFNFLAMAVLGLSAIRKVNGGGLNKIFIPENGYISLNPPLTRRRIGSLSTRTTHPYFLSKIQEILEAVGIDVLLINPYQMKTKGEMLKGCKDQKALEKALPSTVSCSNWHRKGIQCGRCVPCIIRRAAVFYSDFSADAPYEALNLQPILRGGKEKDDLLALATANIRLSKSKDASRWVRESGPLPDGKDERQKLVSVFSRGLTEVGVFLREEKVL